MILYRGAVTRIVSGVFGGRTLQVPARGTRPTSERVREAVFSRLEHSGVLTGARVLDLYAGSGALGIEAVSRGAASAVLVEASRGAAEAARKNVASLGDVAVEVVVDRAERFVARPGIQASAPQWDLVFADPPYDLGDDVLAAVLAGAAARTSEEGMLVVERSTRTGEPSWPAGWRLTVGKVYGETAVYYAEFSGGARDPEHSAAPGVMTVR